MGEHRLAHARSDCHFSPLAQSIGERFLEAYLEGPPTPAQPLYRRAYVQASERLLACEEGSTEARQARREMGLHRAALRAVANSRV
jgi:hypothetical protein